MTTVAQAEQIILAHTKTYGTELVPFERAVGRVLAEDIIADRDLPPYNRATMDGIAISFASFLNGIRSFRLKATMAAGDTPVHITEPDECIEIMTGAAVPYTTDTVIRYEDTMMKNGLVTVTTDTIKKGQNIHLKGKDKQQGETVAKAPCIIDAAVTGMAASAGQNMLAVKKLPKVMIISTGDELVDVSEQPSPFQVRRSNSYTISAVLQQHMIWADTMHLPDDLTITKERIAGCLGLYDVIILSGGISMGLFDYVPQALEELGVTKLFHKVQQRPGKPFWFGIHNGSDTRIFAFPGNPVSGFMCLYRYFLPWLSASLDIAEAYPPYAALSCDVSFTPPLQYYLQVMLQISSQGQLEATPAEGNGSGDFANLLASNAFMELPAEQSTFARSEVYRVWPFKPIL